MKSGDRMGIYIPGMEMPKNGCIKHLLLLRDGSVCSVIDVTSGCQPPPEEQNYIAVPVPPHGRLIDADALAAVAGQRYGVINIGHIDDAPIVIPAEGGIKKDEDTEPWLCLSCRNYPPSSTDGKPCSQCDTSDVNHSCYDPAESAERQMEEL